MTSARLPRESVAAAGLLALDALVRIVAGGPYPGATLFLLLACGLSLLPFDPSELSSPSRRLAVLPALALGSYALLLTTLSVVGIRLTEVSIRLAVLALVLALAAMAVKTSKRERSWSARKEGIAIAALAGVFCVSLAAGWDVVEPFPPPGSDWGYYLLHADEVEARGSLAPENPYGLGEPRRLGSYPGVGAVYGSFMILDGVSSESLSRGLVVAVALTPLAVYAAAAALWGIAAGLLAAAAYAVAPDPPRASVLARPGNDSRASLPPARRPRTRSDVSRQARQTGGRPSRLLAGLPRGDALRECGPRGGTACVGPPRGCHRRVASPRGCTDVVARRDGEARARRNRNGLRPRSGRDRASPPAGSRAGLTGELSILRLRLARPDDARVLLLLAVSRARRCEPGAAPLEPHGPRRPRARSRRRPRALGVRRQPALAHRGCLRVSTRRVLRRPCARDPDRNRGLSDAPQVAVGRRLCRRCRVHRTRFDRPPTARTRARRW